MNCATLVNKSDKPCNAIHQGKLPLWFIVLFIAALMLALSTLAAYFSKQKEISVEMKSQMAVLVDQKATLLLESDVINTNWLRTLNVNMKDVQGGVVWSSEKQQGVVYFKNLPISEENQQYRLWVYDLSKNADTRVSAAQFKQISKPSDDEYLIAIKPELSLKLPYKFELVLEENYSKSDSKSDPNNQNVIEHPLLLAQP